MKQTLILLLLPLFSYSQEVVRGDSIHSTLHEYKLQTVRILQIRNERDQCLALDSINQERINLLNQEVEVWKTMDAVNKGQLKTMAAKINGHIENYEQERKRKKTWRNAAAALGGFFIFQNYMILR